MDSFIKLCDDTENKLGRQLHGREIEFLQWMYDSYKVEQKVKFIG